MLIKYCVFNSLTELEAGVICVHGALSTAGSSALFSIRSVAAILFTCGLLVFVMAKSSAAENSTAEVSFATIPWRKTIQLTLTPSLFSSIGLLVYTITFTHHCEGRLGSGLRLV